MTDNLKRKKIGFQDLAPYVRLVQRIDGDSHYRLPSRIIYDYEVIYVLEGSCIYRIEEQDYIIKTGDLLFMPPMIEHSCHVPAGGHFHYYAAHFDLVYMGEPSNFSVDEIYLSHDYATEPFIPVEEDLMDRPIFELVEVDIPYVVKAGDRYPYEKNFEAMYQAYLERYYGYSIKMKAEMLSLLSLMIREIMTDKGINKRHPQSERIGKAVDWMREHYAEQLQLEDLAQSHFLSLGHFRVLFKEVTGKTPLEFLIGVRMDKARELLANHDLTVGQIAEVVGYPDIHYFSRLFKRVEGLSPLKYAASLRRNR
jgi:AraC-like DNA-binding protein